MIIESNQNTAEILQPRKQAFNLPTAFVAAQLSSVLRFSSFPIRFMRRNQFRAELSQLFIERVRIISLIANQLFRALVGKALKKSFLDKSDFMRRSRVRVDGERKTRAVCHCHEFRALAPLGLSHSEAPFFATINVPSIKHSDKSMPPRECKSSAKVSSTFLSRPLLTHSWNRRRQVWYGGKRAGKSHQRAPERSIQSTPFNISRSARRGRPRIWTVSVLSNNGSIKVHCSSVNSSRRDMREILSNYF